MGMRKGKAFLLFILLNFLPMFTKTAPDVTSKNSKVKVMVNVKVNDQFTAKY